MKITKRLFAMVLCLVMIAAMGVPALASTQSNGDGYTAYNLKWDDPEKGLASFSGQSPFNDRSQGYMVALYKDGAVVNPMNQMNSGGNPGGYIRYLNFSPYMTGAGEYYFTVQCTTLDDGVFMEPELGQLATSPKYTFGGASSIMGDPSNLRWEKTGAVNDAGAAQLRLIWDAPAGWVAGRDSFSINTWGFERSVSSGMYDADGRSMIKCGGAYDIIVKETNSIQHIASVFFDPMTGEPTDLGAWVFSVQTVSGDINTSVSGVEVFCSMAYNAHTKEIIPWEYSNLKSNQKVDSATAPVTPPPTTTPTEQPSSWAADQVNAAIAEKLVPQALQSKYTQATTRAEFCALAVELYESIMGEIAGRSTFDDTDDENVQKAASIGVVTGVGDNKFDPDAQLTREQAAVMLARLSDKVGKPLADSAPSFADNAEISTWAADQVGQIQSAGIMGGVGDNTFAPQDPYTREQSILTIMRLFDYVSQP